MKTARFIGIILLLILVVFSGNEMRKPLRTSTVAFNQEIRLKRGKTITFVPAYNYTYSIQIRSRNSSETIYETIGYVLSVDGKMELVSEKFPLGNAFNEVGSFDALDGDKCSLKFTSLGDKLRSKLVFLKIDVNGGGPSVGNNWQKELRPVIRIVFWTSISVFVFLMIRIVLTKKKNS